MKELIKKNYVTLVTSGYVCSLLTFVAMLQEQSLTNWGKIEITCIGAIVVLMAVTFKNIVSGDKFNWNNVLAAFIGCIIVAVAIAIGVLFNVLSV